jgi:hypothetical protein
MISIAHVEGSGAAEDWNGSKGAIGPRLPLTLKLLNDWAGLNPLPVVVFGWSS